MDGHHGAQPRCVLCRRTDMSRDQRMWQIVVIAAGLALAVVAGVSAQPHIGTPDAAVWTGLLVYVFALGYGANRLQKWLARPPLVASRAVFVGVPAFIPMFLGWFPASNFVTEVARAHEYQYAPSFYWIIFLMFWGILAPGGVVVEGLRKLTGRPASP